MAEKAANYGAEIMRMAEKSILLQILDQAWKDHLLQLDHLRQGIGLRAYGQRDPLNEYKREAFELFEGLLRDLREQVTNFLCHVEIRVQGPQDQMPPPPSGRDPAMAEMAMADGPDDGGLQRQRAASGSRRRPVRPVDLGQGRAQRIVPVRLRPQVQALPRADVGRGYFSSRRRSVAMYARRIALTRDW